MASADSGTASVVQGPWDSLQRLPEAADSASVVVDQASEDTLKPLGVVLLLEVDNFVLLFPVPRKASVAAGDTDWVAVRVVVHPDLVP